MKDEKKLRPIAFVLPQYHPIPENNAWWGKGFTEWTNVTKAKPLFEGHYQPQLPTDLGFYDLRLEASRLAQEALAKAYGIHGFCYYHYWFNGKRLLHEPIDGKLSNPKEDFPFMLCWANENWTRRWDGLDNEVLIQQDYSEEDDVAHMQWLCKNVFADERYIKVEGKPVFVVYKPFLFPDIAKTVKIWREVAAGYGMELYLCHMVFSYNQDCQEVLQGFDAAIDFEPFGIRRQNVFTYIKEQRETLNFFDKIKKRVFGINNKDENSHYNIVDYDWMRKDIKPLANYNFKLYPSIVPGWDNTARRKDNPTLILKDSTPDKFGDWLETINNGFEPYSEDENFIFVNAMNEWAEGNHLEPCGKWGTAYLEKIKLYFG